MFHFMGRSQTLLASSSTTPPATCSSKYIRLSTVDEMPIPGPSVAENTVEGYEQKSRYNKMRPTARDRIQDLTGEVTVSKRQVVACGGCSNVYRGEWVSLRSAEGAGRVASVALKVPRSSKGKRDSVRLRERLYREVNIFMRLNHPNVVKFHGISFAFGGEPAMVMQWCENGTATMFAQRQAIPRRLYMVKEICEGVKYLHSLEPPIIHGDLKGDNVLIDDEGHAMLSDFGLSSETAEYGHDTLGGSLRWQAPELLFDAVNGEGEIDNWVSSPPSVASDVWAFGCTTYEVLLGRLPYHDKELNWTIIQEIMEGRGPVGPDDTLIQESAELSRLLDECWALRPSDRPSITQIAFELEKVVLNG